MIRGMSSFGIQQIIEKYGYEPLDFGKPTDKIIEQLQVIFADLGWNTDLLFVDLNKEGKDLEKQPYFKLWHLLYSFEGDSTPTGNGSWLKSLWSFAMWARSEP
ncbi:MAG: hypothetical protein V8R52_09450 [Coprobacter fastidiosus]